MGTGGVRGEKVALKAKDVLAREREKKKEIKRLLWKDACAFFRTNLQLAESRLWN